MNKQKTFATLWLLLLFTSGLVAGMAVRPMASGGTPRWSLASGLPEQHWVDQHRQRLISELDLTDEQLRQIEPVYAHSSERLREIRETMAGDIRQAVRENRRGLMEILTHEQIDQFKRVLPLRDLATNR